ncbi:MAG: TRAP transporter small permease subunit [Bacteroidia bacterium]|nr:TRAP transporter small permease subunit [Bacteroidia bacterium]
MVCTAGLLGAVLVQIVARFMLVQAPAWTEELARIFFIYAVSFAAGLALKQNYFVAIDLVPLPAPSASVRATLYCFA